MINTIAKDEMKRILLAYQKLELLQPAPIPNGVFINDFTEIWSPNYFTDCRVYLGIYDYQEVKEAFEKFITSNMTIPKKKMKNKTENKNFTGSISILMRTGNIKMTV